jgi:hypothetical protein
MQAPQLACFGKYGEHWSLVDSVFTRVFKPWTGPSDRWLQIGISLVPLMHKFEATEMSAMGSFL